MTPVRILEQFEEMHVSNSQPSGYLALPPAGHGAAVLVLHAWWGLNDTVKAFCRRLAEAGFVVFAPDLYHGNVTDTIAGAEALSSALDAAQARADIAEAVKFVTERAGPASRGLAVIGFSLGAFFALELSVTDPEHVRSVVVFYGTRPGDYQGSQAAYLGHFAETDEFEPQSEVDNLAAALRREGCPVSFYQYPGTGHWFFEPDRLDAFNQAAAELAWERTLAFLRSSSTA
jgi:carboxymethylenebutenolidase